MSDATHQPPADEGGSLGDAASHFTTEAGGVPAHPVWTHIALVRRSKDALLIDLG